MYLPSGASGVDTFKLLLFGLEGVPRNKFMSLRAPDGVTGSGFFKEEGIVREPDSIDTLDDAGESELTFELELLLLLLLGGGATEIVNWGLCLADGDKRVVPPDDLDEMDAKWLIIRTTAFHRTDCTGSRTRRASDAMSAGGGRHVQLARSTSQRIPSMSHNIDVTIHSFVSLA